MSFAQLKSRVLVSNILQSSEWKSVIDLLLEIANSRLLRYVHLTDNGILTPKREAEINNRANKMEYLDFEDMPEYQYTQEVIDIFGVRTRDVYKEKSPYIKKSRDSSRPDYAKLIQEIIIRQSKGPKSMAELTTQLSESN